MISHDFPWSATVEGDNKMLIYFNAIIMNQGSCSIFSAGAFMTRHDSVLFQKAETTGLRTGSLSCIPVLYLSPGVPPEFPPLDYLLHHVYKPSLLHCPPSSLDGAHACISHKSTALTFRCFLATCDPKFFGSQSSNSSMKMTCAF